MKKIFPIILSLLISTALISQETSIDPDAKASLDRIKDKYNSLDEFRVDFELTIDFPEQPAEVQKGTILRKGKAFRMDGEMQTVISDGKTVWVYLSDMDEIQIMDANDETMASMLDPETFLSEFIEGQFSYGITFEGAENGITSVQHIEFKPLDRNSEYAKLRLKINKNDNSLISLQTFQRDGSRYGINFGILDTSPLIPAGSFTFDKSKYPDAHIEDLRM